MSTGVDNGGAGPHPAPPRAAVYPPLPPLVPPRPSPSAYRPVHREPIPPPPSHAPWTPPQHPSSPPPAPRKAPPRAAVALCLVLGLGLLGGAAAGSWINHEPDPARSAQDDTARTYEAARGLWHSIPVDTLFPPTLSTPGAGPGGADRSWTRLGVAPDSDCQGAFDPLLATVLAPIGCVRLLRATYVDDTSSRVTTVGLLVAAADAAATGTLRDRWNAEHLAERGDLMPHTLTVPGTAAAGFGDPQRGSWTVGISARFPAVFYAVSGFADGREISVPQPADEASADGATTAPAQSGLGHDARALATAVEAAFTRSATTALATTGAPR